MVVCLREKCVKCKGKYNPYIVKIEGMYYVRCGCNKWGLYEFLALTEKGAWDLWNRFNRPIIRIGNKKVKNEGDS